LASIDNFGIGCGPQRYRAIAGLIEGLPGKMEVSRLFQVDMVKPAPDARLGKAVIDEITNGVGLLHRIARSDIPEVLQRFRDNFVSRYEQEEVPLLQVLDEDDGIGFAGSGETAVSSFCHPVLLRKLAEVLQRGEHEMELSSQDLSLLESQ